MIHFDLPILVLIGLIVIFFAPSLYWYFKYYDKWKQEKYRDLHFSIYALYLFDDDFKNFIDLLNYKKYNNQTEECELFGIVFRCPPSFLNKLSREIEMKANSIIKDPIRNKELELCRIKLERKIFTYFKTYIVPRRQEELDALQFGDAIYNVFKSQDISKYDVPLSLDFFLAKFSLEMNISLSEADNIISRITNRVPPIYDRNSDLSIISVNKIENKIMLGYNWEYIFTSRHPYLRSFWDNFKYTTTNNFIRFKPYKYF